MARAQFWTQIFQNQVNVGYCGILPSLQFYKLFPNTMQGHVQDFGKVGCRIKVPHWTTNRHNKTLKTQFVSERVYMYLPVKGDPQTRSTYPIFHYI